MNYHLEGFLEAVLEGFLGAVLGAPLCRPLGANKKINFTRSAKKLIFTYMKWTKPTTLLQWANRTLGPSQCKQICYIDTKTRVYGYWDWEETIYLNKRHIRSVGTLYRVLAHEWTHAKQDYKLWRFYQSRYGYERNPYELEARRAERALWRSDSFGPMRRI